MPRTRPRTRPIVEALEGRALLASLMVTNALDSGAGSLRQAILDADAATGSSAIGFAIPGAGIHTISPASPLPSISAPVTIDGTTQPGYSGTPLIALDGAADGGDGGTDVGLDIEPGSDNAAVKGLAIDRFANTFGDGEGVLINANSVSVQNNLIGVDPAGKPAAGNDSGIVVGHGSVMEVISNNVIGENVNGIDLQPVGSAAISGNFIGTDSKGAADIGNGDYGIVAEAGSGPSTASNNTIARNGSGAIHDLSGGGLTLAGNTITDNASPLDLGVTASDASIIASVGQAFTTTYTVTDNGSSAADASVNLQARNQFQTIMKIFERSLVFEIEGAQVSQGTTTNQGNYSTSISALFGTIQPGRSATITLTGKIIGAGPDFIDATFDPPATVGNPETGTVASTTVSGIGRSDIVATGLPAPQARVGVPETFLFTVTTTDPNNRVDPLFALQFTTTGGNAATGVTTSSGSVMALPAYPNGYGGDVGSIYAGQVVVIAATIIPPTSGTVTATLFAYSPYQVPPTPANNLAFAASTVVPASSPTVLGATLLPTSGAITAVAVDFDNPLNASQAKNVRNYALTTSNHARISIGSAFYNPTTRVVTLRLSRPLARPASAVQLVVAGLGSPGLTGSGGSKLLNAGESFNLATT